MLTPVIHEHDLNKLTCNFWDVLNIHNWVIDESCMSTFDSRSAITLSSWDHWWWKNGRVSCYNSYYPKQKHHKHSSECHVNLNLRENSTSWTTVIVWNQSDYRGIPQTQTWRHYISISKFLFSPFFSIPFVGITIIVIYRTCLQGPLLLTWINFNPSMDK